jgi:hypothetical protein
MRKFCVIDYIAACTEREIDRHRSVMTILCDKMVVYDNHSDDYREALTESRREMLAYKSFFLLIFSNNELAEAISRDDLPAARSLIGDFLANRS